MFKFDFPSFVLGLIVAWAIAIVVYRERAGVQRITARLRERANQLRNSLTANIDLRSTVRGAALCRPARPANPRPTCSQCADNDRPQRGLAQHHTPGCAG